MEITILGCGASAGLPIIGTPEIGGFWGDCDPNNPKNRRTRSSILIEDEGRRILIDTSPDLRAQVLANEIVDVEAILYTHDHADHTHGIDELRTLFHVTKRSSPYRIYGTSETIKDLKRRFTYLFEGSPAILSANEITPYEEFQVEGLKVLPFPQTHGPWTSTGFRYKGVAYSTDVKDLEAQAFACLQGLDLWIVDCLSRTPAPTHTHLAQTLDWIERIKPKQAILTHMNYTLDYEKLRKELPPHIKPAYDGLQLIIS